MQALPAQPESLCIVEMGGTEKQDELGERGSIGFLYLNIGLQVRDLEAHIVGVRASFTFMTPLFNTVPVVSVTHLMRSEQCCCVPLISALIRTHQA